MTVYVQLIKMSSYCTQFVEIVFVFVLFCFASNKNIFYSKYNIVFITMREQIHHFLAQKLNYFVHILVHSS